jgi:hypothetical protein
LYCARSFTSIEAAWPTDVVSSCDAINRAIDASAAAGGGTVYFPAGIYASHSVRLRSHVGLSLDHGATLLAADTGSEKVPGVPTFVLRDVEEFRVGHSGLLPERYLKRVTRQSF